MSNTVDINRLLPQDTDAEACLLSGAFRDFAFTMGVCEEIGITLAHFQAPAHSTIYDAMLEFWRDNEPLELRILTGYLRDRHKLEKAGGAAFVTDIGTLMPTAANALRYAEILKEKYALRELIRMGTECAGRAYTEQDNVSGLLAHAQEMLGAVIKLGEGKRIHNRTMRELVMRSSERIQAALDGDGRIEMPYGIHTLDFETGGLRAPEVSIISGKSSDGKTAIALNTAEHLATERQKKVGIISLEMSDDQLTDRLLASVARVNIREIKRSRAITDDQHQRIVAASKKLSDAPIFIRDDGQLSISEIGATFASWKSQYGLDVGIIDHAQLARGDGRTTGRTEEVEQISRALKPMAKRLGIALIVLSQVSEDQHGGYRTKNSMALTEDADNLFTISHRAAEGGGTDSWINISKQRDGERNKSIPVTFLQNIGRFEAREKEPEPELIDMGKPPNKNRNGARH